MTMAHGDDELRLDSIWYAICMRAVNENPFLARLQDPAQVTSALTEMGLEPTLVWDHMADKTKTRSYGDTKGPKSLKDTDKPNKKGGAGDIVVFAKGKLPNENDIPGEAKQGHIYRVVPEENPPKIAPGESEAAVAGTLSMWEWVKEMRKYHVAMTCSM